MSDPQPQPSNLPQGQRDTGRQHVLAPDGVRSPSASEGADPAQKGGEGSKQAEQRSDIESPAKIIRIGAMVKQMLEEVRNTSIDDAARDQLRRIYDSSIEELKDSLSEDLGDELEALTFDFTDGETPSEAELRMAQAQLVGWLEGLFHGIQATLVTQQMAARQQLEGMRGQLPEPPGSPGHGPGYI